MTDNREFIGEFLVESSENLDQLDRDLLALEERPGDSQRVASIFRTVHTIKGNSGFFGFSKLGALAHSGEHLLGRLRDGKLTLDDRVTGSLYSMVDAVRTILRTIEATGGEGEHDYRDLSRALAAVAAGEESMPAAPATPSPATEPAAAVTATAEPPDASTAPATPPDPTTTVAAVERAPPQPELPAPTGPGVVDSTVRVDVGLLASILDLVGELVLARNQLRSVDSDDPAVQACTQRINTVTNALQETAVRTRLQPVDHVFSRFPRTVRDLAVSCGKEVQLVIDGADTELDRSLIESIRDPLTHLIRNAVDHGIEPPEARVGPARAAGLQRERPGDDRGLRRRGRDRLREGPREGGRPGAGVGR
ncbi:MAG: Hpt domain-containing protein [Planctomycetaceae bacterium]|nr:Hpt domain-containing protein [Planctomycetaceae bacterium]